MKITKYLLGICVFVITGMTSCKKNFEEINTPHTDPETASIAQLYNGIISSLPITAAEYSVMNSWIYPLTQQGVVAGSNSYPFDNARSAIWQNYYTAMANYRLIQSAIHEISDTTSMNNVYAMLRTIMAYKTFKITNYFGDIPYTNAGYSALWKSSGYSPSYDSQESIYSNLLSDLDWAIDNLSTASTQYSLAGYETFLGGDITAWKAFANSLRLYIAVTMYDKNSSLAGTSIAKSMAMPLLTGDNIGLWPNKIANLQFQWRQWSFSTDCNLRMGSTMWGLLSNSNDVSGSGIYDPRTSIFFETNGSNNWVAVPQNLAPITETGTPYNILNRDSSWSKKGGNNYSAFNYFFEKDITYIPELILTTAQVHFLKAEVYNRGLGVSANAASAKQEYEAGITSSVNMWKSIAYNSSVWTYNKPSSPTATATELNVLLGNTKVVYNTSDASAALRQIYAQAWIDEYRQPFDAWTLYRRTGAKTPMEATNAQQYMNTYGSYNRFRYPDEEMNYNKVNWVSATGGTDLVSKKIWIQP